MIKLTRTVRKRLALIVAIVLLPMLCLHFQPVLYELYQAGWSWQLTREICKMYFGLVAIVAIVDLIISGPTFEVVISIVNYSASAILTAVVLHYVPLLISLYQDGLIDGRWFGQAAKLVIVVGCVSFGLWIVNSISSHFTGDIRRA